jgi:tetratricopeptide (TPR) repeat protein
MPVVLAAVACASILTAWTVGQDTARTTAVPAPDTAALSEARALINDDKPAAAIKRLEPLDAPGRADVGLLMGVAYYHLNDHARAIERLSPIADTLPAGSTDQREAVQVLGLSLFLVGRYADAVPRLEATRVWASSKARAAFARTFGLDEQSAAASLLAAQMMIRLQFEAFAEAELRRAIEMDPKLPQAHALLGQMALFRGRFDEAVTETERDLAINPTNAMAYYQLGDARIRQGRQDDGIAALQKSLWINPYYSAPYIVLGKAYLQKGNLPTAEGMLTRAIEYDPNNRSAHYLLGQVYQRAGRASDAAKEFAIAERLQGQPGRQ